MSVLTRCITPRNTDCPVSPETIQRIVAQRRGVNRHPEISAFQITLPCNALPSFHRQDARSSNTEAPKTDQPPCHPSRQDPHQSRQTITVLINPIIPDFSALL